MPARREVTGEIAASVPGLDAFIFDGKYLFDAKHEAAITQRREGTSSFLVHLDGIQRDRLHVSAALASAFPGFAAATAAGLVSPSKKILAIDFAYYVLQGNAYRDGHVVIPINQQMDDVRAANLTLLPGADRKAYRSTEVIPRDGIVIDPEVFRFLPRTVTLINSPQSGEYQFKHSPTGGGETAKFGCGRADARRVFYGKVVPRLLAADAGFFEKNAVYQALCASYFSAFPDELTASLAAPVGMAESAVVAEEAAVVVAEEAAAAMDSSTTADRLPPPAVSALVRTVAALGRVDVHLPEIDAVARVVNGKPTTLYDRKYHTVLSALNWDPDDMRLATSPALRAAYPKSFPPGVAKEFIAVFVARELVGTAIDSRTQCVVPFNQIRFDIREANLLVAIGTGKNFKAPKTLKPPDGVKIRVPFGDAGDDGSAAVAVLEYLPRGVTMCVDRNQIPFSSRLLQGKPVKIAAAAGTASAVFKSAIVPILERDWETANQEMVLVRPPPADPAAVTDPLKDWRSGHVLYSFLAQSYEEAIAAATASD